MDAETVCLQAILPKIVTAAPPPPPDELLTLTRYCKNHLDVALIQHKELWLVNAEGRVRKANELLLPAAFKPDRNWEKHARYVPGVDFVTADYLNEGSTPVTLGPWRAFLESAGVKPDPDNGVEVFAVNFAKEKLASRFQNIVPVEKLNHGYDLEAEDAPAQKVHIEVKGQTVDNAVELTGNEARAARAHGQTFYLCVVPGIPETPRLYLLRDPDGVGDRDKLTIRTADWKRELLEGRS